VASTNKNVEPCGAGVDEQERGALRGGEPEFGGRGGSRRAITLARAIDPGLAVLKGAKARHLPSSRRRIKGVGRDFFGLGDGFGRADEVTGAVSRHPVGFRKRIHTERAFGRKAPERNVPTCVDVILVDFIGKQP